MRRNLLWFFIGVALFCLTYPAGELGKCIPHRFFWLVPPASCLIGAFSIWFVLANDLVERYLRARTAKAEKGITCLTCGYDLRASKDRCPECGTAF